MRPAHKRLANVELHPAKREQFRREVYKREGGRCFFCKTRVRLHWKGQFDGEQPDDAATLDHIIPKSQGGRYELQNLVCACRICNARRGSRDAGKFLESTYGDMAKHGGTDA
jgi:5-methylcytosine-specific restriction endonuclease McrA